MYGPNSKKPGTYAANCILARKLIEKDVRFVQLYHMGWDQHENLPTQIRGQANDIDQPTAALIMDLKQLQQQFLLHQHKKYKEMLHRCSPTKPVFLPKYKTTFT